jgi:hypothetical protein
MLCSFVTFSSACRVVFLLHFHLSSALCSCYHFHLPSMLCSCYISTFHLLCVLVTFPPPCRVVFVLLHFDMPVALCSCVTFPLICRVVFLCYISVFLYRLCICLKRSVLVLQHQMSNDKQVALKSVNLKSSGTYRCEVSAERPNFSSAGGEGRMEVVCKSQHFYTYAFIYVQCNLNIR